MEAGEENSGNTNLKRQRAPLSDSEDNVFTSSEGNDVQKRRRLEADGQENRSPKPSSSGRQAELETKPDTPMVPSVRSRVQQLTQRREGAAPLTQRCLSDPGAVSPSLIIHEKGFREHLLGEGEFSERMERFKVPVFQASPAPTENSTTPCPRSCSNFVSDIQQKLQGTTTPSSKQAVRMRQERELELSQLHFQPISENVWLKRSSSDPSLTQADGETEMKDGSFTEASSSSAKNQSSDGTGKRPRCDAEAPAASVEADNSNKQPQIEQKEQNTYQSKEVGEEKGNKASVGGEEQFRSQHSQTQTVLKLSFSDDQSFSSAPFGEDQNMSELPTGGDQGLLESTYSEESNVNEKGEVSKITERKRSEVFSFEEVANDCSSYHEERMETSTDEELRLWRYPQECKEEEESILAEQQEEDMCAKEEEGELESSRVEEEKGGSVAECSEPFDIQDGECDLSQVSAEIAGSSEMQEGDGDELESESCLDESLKNKSKESSEGYYEGAATGDHFTIEQDQEETEGCTHEDDVCQQSKEIQTVSIKEEDMDLESESRDPSSTVKQRQASPLTDVGLDTELESNTEYAAKPDVETESSDIDGGGGVQGVTEVQASDQLLEADEMEQEAVDVSQSVVEETERAEEGESSKKVTFFLEPELINDSALSETNVSMESRVETSMSGENSKRTFAPEDTFGEVEHTEAELSSHDETNTAEIIDQMFDEVLEYAGRIEEERLNHEDTEDRDSGIGTCSGESSKIDMESEKEKSEKEADSEEELDQTKNLESNGDEMLTFPSSGILSPLSKSVEAVVTPLRLTVGQESNPPSLLLTPEETTTPPVESAPLYSIDAYRTQRQSKPSTIQSVTPGVQRRAPEKSQPQPSVNTKEKITALNQETGKLQNVISQTLQALSCCTDEEHGRGSLEEAEAEKLLLVSCEKRSALLAEMTRLREERSSESGEAAAEDREYISQQPCRGTVSITNIQLPLKVEFVCSSHNRTGRPSHYFFILIRYGPCNIVATPLATAADAQNGDTISFPTSVTLKDIRSSFEIDVEVYSLSHTSGSSCTMDRATTKSRVTPRKLLNTITRSNNSLTAAAPPALNTRRSSNFSMVGSHKITLASLGHSKFPLDKMKLEGKIRRLLGDEFQEKVPFLSPLEGNIYLRLDSEGHSNVEHQGFLTMFELISGFGVWHRRFFVLKGCDMYYWNHPNDRETKGAEGSVSLSSSHSRCVRPVKRDSCARPFTFELVSNIPQQQQDNSQEALAKLRFLLSTEMITTEKDLLINKCWFSADTKQERLDWMEKLNQVLLDFHTWNPTSASQQSNTSSTGNLRESIL